MALSSKLKEWLVTVAIYGSILIPMFIMIRDPQPTVETGSQQHDYSPTAPVAQFVVMRKKHAARVRSLGFSPVEYKDRYIGFYVDEYPQLLVDDKVAVKVGTLKVFFDRLDIVGVAPVHERSQLPPFAEVAAIK